MREGEGGGREREAEECPGKVAVMYLALSCPVSCHGRLGPTLRFVTASRGRVRDRCSRSRSLIIVIVAGCTYENREMAESRYWYLMVFAKRLI